MKAITAVMAVEVTTPLTVAINGQMVAVGGILAMIIFDPMVVAAIILTKDIIAMMEAVDYTLLTVVTNAQMVVGAFTNNWWFR